MDNVRVTRDCLTLHVVQATSADSVLNSGNPEYTYIYTFSFIVPVYFSIHHVQNIYTYIY
jgi:hypothetical protein